LNVEQGTFVHEKNLFAISTKATYKTGMVN
jgi:hypothetical protein